jgi:hypothetical protein
MALRIVAASVIMMALRASGLVEMGSLQCGIMRSRCATGNGHRAFAECNTAFSPVSSLSHSSSAPQRRQGRPIERAVGMRWRGML